MIEIRTFNEFLRTLIFSGNATKNLMYESNLQEDAAKLANAILRHSVKHNLVFPSTVLFSRELTPIFKRTTNGFKIRRQVKVSHLKVQDAWLICSQIESQLPTTETSLLEEIAYISVD